jgi:hypothetical protein
MTGRDALAGAVRGAALHVRVVHSDVAAALAERLNDLIDAGGGVRKTASNPNV